MNSISFDDMLNAHHDDTDEKLRLTVGSVLERIKFIMEDPNLTADEKLRRIQSLEEGTREITREPLSPVTPVAAIGSGSATDRLTLDFINGLAQATKLSVDVLLRLLQPVLQPLAGKPLADVQALLIGAGSVTKGDTPVNPDGTLAIVNDATLKAENDRLKTENDQLGTDKAALTTEVAKLEKKLKELQENVIDKIREEIVNGGNGRGSLHRAIDASALPPAVKSLLLPAPTP